MAASVVRDIMTKEIVTIDGDKTALEAAKLMAEKGISSLFVMKDAQPVGIVTERDFNNKICRLPIMEGGKIVGIITVTDLAKHLRTTLLLEGTLSDSDSFDNMIATMDHD